MNKIKQFAISKQKSPFQCLDVKEVMAEKDRLNSDLNNKIHENRNLKSEFDNLKESKRNKCSECYDSHPCLSYREAGINGNKTTVLKASGLSLLGVVATPITGLGDLFTPNKRNETKKMWNDLGDNLNGYFKCVCGHYKKQHN